MPHGGRREGKEVRAVAPLGARLVHQLEVRLVEEFRGRERAVLPRPDVPARDRPQLLIDEWKQTVKRLVPARAKAVQYVGMRRHDVRVSSTKASESPSRSSARYQVWARLRVLTREEAAVDRRVVENMTSSPDKTQQQEIKAAQRDAFLLVAVRSAGRIG